MPTFSILLPTRNRLQLLSYAIETVRRQDFADWEIVVSDNASEEDVKGYVSCLREDRIRYTRTASFIPVTENWNNALAHSTGRWVLMLGDDDGLMPGALTRFAELTERSEPDLIYGNAFVFTYPGVLPDSPRGSLRPYSHSALFAAGPDPYVLDPAAAKDLVRRAMHFEMAFTFNMQHSVIDRRLIDRLSTDGGFFHSPYPDFYATNLLFLEATRILIDPARFVTIGVSQKSFGYFYFNRREREGVAFLNNATDPREWAELQDVVLPGRDDRTSWLIAMLELQRRFGARHGLNPDVRRYRRLQIASVFGTDPYAGAFTAADRAAMKSRLSPYERFVDLPFFLMGARLIGLLPTELRARLRETIRRRITRTPRFSEPIGPEYRDMLDVYERAGADPG
jgi:glycosyltransferase involved in cell wall biosynthesis